MDTWFQVKVLRWASPSRPAPSRPAASALGWEKTQAGREKSQLPKAGQPWLWRKIECGTSHVPQFRRLHLGGQSGSAAFNSLSTQQAQPGPSHVEKQVGCRSAPPPHPRPIRLHLMLAEAGQPAANH